MNSVSRISVSLRARLQSWLRAVTSRSRLEGEMDAELTFHLESYIEDLVERGMPREKAERQARIEFGGTSSPRRARTTDASPAPP